MSVTHILPSLEDMGMALFGPDWRGPLAGALGLDLNEVIVWDEYPTMIPANVEDGLKAIGEMRVQEIKFMLEQMAQTGLNRNTSAEGEDED